MNPTERTTGQPRIHLEKPEVPPAGKKLSGRKYKLVLSRGDIEIRLPAMEQPGKLKLLKRLTHVTVETEKSEKVSVNIGEIAKAMGIKRKEVSKAAKTRDGVETLLKQKLREKTLKHYQDVFLKTLKKERKEVDLTTNLDKFLEIDSTYQMFQHLSQETLLQVVEQGLSLLDSETETVRFINIGGGAEPITFVAEKLTDKEVAWSVTAGKLGSGSFKYVFDLIGLNAQSQQVLLKSKPRQRAIEDLQKEHPIINWLNSEGKQRGIPPTPHSVQVLTSPEGQTGYMLARRGGANLFENPAFDALPLSQKLKLCADLAHGLSFIHARRCIHGDIKPENSLPDEPLEEAWIMDYGGFVSIEKGDEKPTAFTARYLTYSDFYLAGIDRQASDVFALAKSLIEMLTNKDEGFIYDSNNVVVGVNPLYLFSNLRKAGIPFDLIDCLLECVAMNSKERPQAHDLLTLLEEAREALPS